MDKVHYLIDGHGPLVEWCRWSTCVCPTCLCTEVTHLLSDGHGPLVEWLAWPTCSMNLDHWLSVNKHWLFYRSVSTHSSLKIPPLVNNLLPSFYRKVVRSIITELNLHCSSKQNCLLSLICTNWKTENVGAGIFIIEIWADSVSHLSALATFFTNN